MIPAATPEIGIDQLAGAVRGDAAVVGVPASQRCHGHASEPAAGRSGRLRKLFRRG